MVDFELSFRKAEESAENVCPFFVKGTISHIQICPFPANNECPARPSHARMPRRRRFLDQCTCERLREGRNESCVCFTTSRISDAGIFVFEALQVRRHNLILDDELYKCLADFLLHFRIAFLKERRNVGDRALVGIGLRNVADEFLDRIRIEDNSYATKRFANYCLTQIESRGKFANVAVMSPLPP
jgi:hypothetical protein